MDTSTTIIFPYNHRGGTDSPPRSARCLFLSFSRGFAIDGVHNPRIARAAVCSNSAKRTAAAIKAPRPREGEKTVNGESRPETPLGGEVRVSCRCRWGGSTVHGSCYPSLPSVCERLLQTLELLTIALLHFFDFLAHLKKCLRKQNEMNAVQKIFKFNVLLLSTLIIFKKEYPA